MLLLLMYTETSHRGSILIQLVSFVLRIPQKIGLSSQMPPNLIEENMTLLETARDTALDFRDLEIVTFGNVLLNIGALYVSSRIMVLIDVEVTKVRKLNPVK